MACVPSDELTRAFGRGVPRAFYGRGWALLRPGEDTVELRHHGTAVLRVERGVPVQVRVTSVSDRDGVNGLLRLMGLDSRWRARFHTRDGHGYVEDAVTGGRL